MFIRATLRRAITSFLAIPTGIIVAFVLLAIGAYGLDRTDPASLRPLSDFMQAHVFGVPESTATLLGTIATGVITTTSITSSLLLLALRQSAGSLTPQVFDQFLRRRLNQVYRRARSRSTTCAIVWRDGLARLRRGNPRMGCFRSSVRTT